MPVRTQTTKSRQISVRLHRDTDTWLERRAGGRQRKAEFVRQLIEKERARERQEQLLAMFDRAAADVTETDREERELLLGGFAGDVGDA